MIRPLIWLLLLANACSAVELDDAQVLEILSTQQPRDAAIARGLAWLRTQTGRNGGINGERSTALTGLAVMAHLAAGVVPQDPAQGPWLRLGLGYVLDRQDRSGYFGGPDTSRMYGHGIATLLCAEALGACRDADLDERLRDALERAVAVTVRAARIDKIDEHRGGWRYDPTANDSDLSLTGWQLMSLVAARKVGVAVPEDVVTAAVTYVRRMIAADGRVGYQRASDDRKSLRGLALLALTIAPQDGDRQIMARITVRMQADTPTWDAPWALYRAHYDAIGLGVADPTAWTVYGPTWQQLLLKHQAADGSWTAGSGEERSMGQAYATAMAVLSLAVERQVLPAFAR